ncbi:MAG: amylo-alpha-1,6-glucosidase [Bacteroidota bacterium]|nr:amylo-alpha-1,6-glucosidase [Bacteroidota bacterium]
MSYIKFDKSKLINLEYSLGKELVRTSRSGAYASTTLVGCNTRKYHGLLVAPQPGIDNDMHVLLSNLDLTVIQHEAEFNLGIHKYPGDVYNPKGHKYIRDFEADPIPRITYRLGGVVLTMERLFHTNDERILIKFTLVEAHSPTRLRFKPFLAFRNIHRLTRENIHYSNKYQQVRNGIKIRMYDAYTPLYMQFSKKAEYTHVPDWFYNIEYFREQQRGYDYQEDLYVPGFFELPVKKGESIIFSAGLDEVHPPSLEKIFDAEVGKRIPRNNFKNCLLNSAQQLLIKQNKESSVIAGLPWHGMHGRDTFIALPGLCLIHRDYKTFRAVSRSMIKKMQGPLFPSHRENTQLQYHSVDASLWFIWALQQYYLISGKKARIWKDFGKPIRQVLFGFREGKLDTVRMDSDMLIHAEDKDIPLSWMNACVDGIAVTPRSGKTVEVNALWYNAICFALEMAEKENDRDFIKEWKEIPEKLADSFNLNFWNEDRAYLADFIGDSGPDWSVRPNQVVAASLEYTPLSTMMKRNVLQVIKNELLTPRGLRSLSPKNPDYRGRCEGNVEERDSSLHQGAAWPWLMGHYAEASLKLYGKQIVPEVENLLHAFEKEMTEDGIGSISEYYAGDPPYMAGGTISQAWNVAELLRIDYMIRKFKMKKEDK